MALLGLSADRRVAPHGVHFAGRGRVLVNASSKVDHMLDQTLLRVQHKVRYRELLADVDGPGRTAVTQIREFATQPLPLAP